MAEYRQKTADRRFFVCALLIVTKIVEICIDKFVFCAIIQVEDVNEKGVIPMMSLISVEKIVFVLEFNYEITVNYERK